MKLNVRVVPNAKHNKIVNEVSRLKVYVISPAIEGAANKALIEFLAEHYGIRRNKIKILKGEKGRDKIIEIKEREA